MTTVESSDEIAPVEGEHEIVDGRVVDCPGWSPYPGLLVTKLGVAIGNHAEGRILFRTLFRLDDQNHRRPSVAFVSYKRWSKKRRLPWGDSWDVVPDLAVEVISQNDKAWDVLDKVQIYLESGVRAVWLVYPKQAMVMVYESFPSNRAFTRADILDGGIVLPDFRLSLASYFEEDAEAASEA